MSTTSDALDDGEFSLSSNSRIEFEALGRHRPTFYRSKSTAISMSTP